MPQPTSIIPGITDSAAQASSFAQLEFDEPSNTLEPNDYIYLLAHMPPGKQVFEPFKSSDSGPMQLIGMVEEERAQAGLELNAENLSVQLTYYPFDTPVIVFFGNSIAIDQSKLRSGLVVPTETVSGTEKNPYDGTEVYKFNVYYKVQFARIRHLPNHPLLISEADGGILWENYKGTESLKSWPVTYQVGYE